MRTQECCELPAASGDRQHSQGTSHSGRAAPCFLDRQGRALGDRAEGRHGHKALPSHRAAHTPHKLPAQHEKKHLQQQL